MRLLDPSKLTDFVAAVFRAAGSEADEAQVVADHLVGSNLAGHDSHGIVRVRKYLAWVAAGEVVANRHATVISDHGGTILVDGGFGYGQVIGREAMQMLAERVSRLGFAALSIRNAGHLGRIGAWPEQLAEAGFPSFHFVNTSGYGILVAPHGGSDRRLSANPIAAGSPRQDGPPLILDIATSVIAEGKIQLLRNKDLPLPEGAVIDGQGHPTTDARSFYADPPGAILPFGGHKGSGLSVFCEIFAGSLSGGFASNPASPTAGRLVNNMLSVAFNPAMFGGADFFSADISRLGAWATASPPLTPDAPVLLPGEIEARTRTDRLEKGIPVDEETWRQLETTAESVGVRAGDFMI